MTTLYPSRIDGYGQIRVVRDNIGEIIARDHNDLRSALVSIEKILGTSPQGSSASVVARLDDINTLIQNHSEGSSPRHNDLHIFSWDKTGTYNEVAQGTTNSQIQQLLGYLNDLYSSSGSGILGAEVFSTLKNNYSTYLNNVQGQTGEFGGILDKNVDYLQKVFDSFVVEGMLVSSSNFTDVEVNISSGVISCQGMLVDSSEQTNLTLLSAPGDGTYYVYVERNSNSVVYGATDDLSGVISEVETIIILAEVVLDSGSVSVFDMRRFGVFSNDRTGFVVGKAPINGNDGYGCDFLSLKAAVKTLSLFQDNEKFIKNSKILLASDIDINSDVESEIVLPNNIEIDGGGNTITFSSQTSLFLVDSYNVTLKNIVVVPDFSIPYHTGSFIRVAESTNVTNLTITDCFIKSSGSTQFDLEYFMYIGGNFGTSVDKCVIKNNNVAIYNSGIVFDSVSSLLNNTIIEGNKFYQTDAYNTLNGVGISVGSYSKVLNNILDGGFNTGIYICEGTYTDINNNLVIGSRDTTYYMENGILLKNSTPVYSSCLILNNIVRGVNLFGINSVYGDGYSSHVIIESNIVDNVVPGVEQPINMSAIYCSNQSETTVSNNIILYPGLSSYAIYGAKNILGNYIYCTPTPSATYDVFSIFVNDCESAFVSQNTIINCDGSGISMEFGCNGTTVIDNLIHNIFSETSFSISSYCIYANSNYMSILNNTILGSELSAINRIGINCSGEKAIISGNSLHNLNNLGIGSFGIENVISNNILTEVKYGLDCNNTPNCIIRDNLFLTDSGFDFVSSEDAIYNIGNGSLVEGNYIYGYGQSTTNIMISCGTSQEISVLNNVISSCIGVAIDCSSSDICKIDNNYIFSSYDGIKVKEKTDVLNNMIFSPERYGVSVFGNNNLISSNTVINSFDSGIYISGWNQNSILNNYLYNILNYGVYVDDCSGTLIVGNYLISEQTLLSDSYFVYIENSLHTVVNGNMIVNMNVSDNFFNIYFTEVRNCIVNSNYIFSNNSSGDYGIYSRESLDFSINNNYIFNTEKSSINIGATSISVGQRYFIGNNYILKTNATDNCIYLDDVVKNIMIFNNFVNIEETDGNSFGIYIGNSDDRNILLSSNQIYMENDQMAVYFTGSDIKLIGNMALGGIAPDPTYWSAGFVNLNANNVYSAS